MHFHGRFVGQRPSDESTIYESCFWRRNARLALYDGVLPVAHFNTDAERRGGRRAAALPAAAAAAAAPPPPPRALAALAAAARAHAPPPPPSPAAAAAAAHPVARRAALAAAAALSAAPAVCADDEALQALTGIDFEVPAAEGTAPAAGDRRTLRRSTTGW